MGDDLLTAIALPRVHDQVVPNSTFVEHWTAGKATFFFPEDEIQVGPIRRESTSFSKEIKSASIMHVQVDSAAACHAFDAQSNKSFGSTEAWCANRGDGCIAIAAVRSVYINCISKAWYMQALEEKGHKVETSSWGAVVQGILVDPSDGYLTGMSDPRKDGAPSGY